ncbi:MAG: hypothetical protein CMH30_01515 [Micavibrio sp.]|nr:hypothetical protein [Micavibrio sp.]
MTPAARIAGLIDLLEQVFTWRLPVDVTAGDWFRNKKYIGSKDRSEIAERLYRIMRHKARYSWHLAQSKMAETPRNFAIIDCAFHDEKPEERLFSGGGKYAVDGLSPEETKLLHKHLGQDIETKDMPLDVQLEAPEWAAEMLKRRFGKNYEPEMRAMQTMAPLDIRVNTIGTTIEAAMGSLHKDGVRVQRTHYAPHGLRVEGKAYLAKTKAFSKGHVEIQDEGSQMIAALCGVKSGMRVLDYCAGGGGKTLALAAQMGNKGSIVATDMDERRLERGRKRYRKAHIHNVELKCLKDEKTQKWFKRQKETFDVVLVDAPCSSSGTWRRNPELRWHFYGPSLDEIKALQTDILNRVGKAVKKGGRLVYATCSLFEEENEAQIKAFLDVNPDFKVLPVQQAWADMGFDTQCPDTGDFMKLSPAAHGTDGFFTAILEKK